MEQRQELQRRQLAVAGGGILAENGMAGLLAAQHITARLHLLQHVAVPYVGAVEVDPVFPAEDPQAHIAHHGSDQGVSRKLSLLLQGQSAGGDDLIAVDLLSGFVYHQATVCVAVKCDAEIIAARLHHGPEAVQMGGAAAVIDVHSIRVGMDHIGMQVGETVKQTRGGGGSGAVGAVHQNVQARKVCVHRGDQIVDVVLRLLLVGIDDPADLTVGLERHGGPAQDDLLDLSLQRVGELEAPMVEDLDAVVFKGIVGSRDHDARVGLGVHRDPGHGGRWDDPQMEHVRPGGAQSRDQRPLQQV